eukprot:475860_1
MLVLWTYVVIITSILAIICIIPTIYICYHLLLQYQKSDKPVKYYSILSAVSFTVSTTTRSISVMYSTKNELTITHNAKRRQIAELLIITSAVSWTFGVAFLYLLIIFRLKRTYNKSLFKIFHCDQMCFYIFIVLALILSFFVSLDYDVYMLGVTSLMVLVGMIDFMIT